MVGIAAAFRYASLTKQALEAPTRHVNSMEAELMDLPQYLIRPDFPAGSIVTCTIASATAPSLISRYPPTGRSPSGLLGSLRPRQLRARAEHPRSVASRSEAPLRE